MFDEKNVTAKIRGVIAAVLKKRGNHRITEHRRGQTQVPELAARRDVRSVIIDLRVGDTSRYSH